MMATTSKPTLAPMALLALLALLALARMLRVVMALLKKTAPRNATAAASIRQNAMAATVPSLSVAMVTLIQRQEKIVTAAMAMAVWDRQHAAAANASQQSLQIQLRRRCNMKQLTILIFYLLAPLSASAAPELSVAPKGGPNSATLAENFRVNRYGFSGGLAGYIQWPLVDRFFIASQMELLYTTRGAETILEGEYLGRSREHYFDLMVAARPEARLGWASVYLLLGGGLNLLVSANKDDAAGEGQDITGDLHRVDVALLGAAGVALHLPRHELGPVRLGTVFLEARHDIGLLDTDAVNGGFKNRTSSLMLGLSFVMAGSPSPATTATPGE